jgi:hypothetical protein
MAHAGRAIVVEVEAIDVHDGSHASRAGWENKQRPTERPASHPTPEGEGGVIQHKEANPGRGEWSTLCMRRNLAPEKGVSMFLRVEAHAHTGGVWLNQRPGPGEVPRRLSQAPLHGLM